jgi:hypothetical protein
MRTLAIPIDAPADGPKLRLLPKKCNGRRRRGHLELASQASHLELASQAEHEPEPDRAGARRSILLAGGEASDREAVLCDLRRRMPGGTSFKQAETLWEMLARAAESSMVVLSGKLEDVCAESLMQMLAHRNPTLPVVSLNPPSPLGRARTSG